MSLIDDQANQALPVGLGSSLDAAPVQPQQSLLGNIGSHINPNAQLPQQQEEYLPDITHPIGSAMDVETGPYQARPVLPEDDQDALPVF